MNFLPNACVKITIRDALRYGDSDTRYIKLYTGTDIASKTWPCLGFNVMGRSVYEL